MQDKKYPSQTEDKYMLRLPDGMRKSIKKAALDNDRSMNSEIVHCLKQKYQSDITNA